MAIRSNLGAGYALVPVPPVQDWETWVGGGPISRSSQASVPAHAGNYVYRAPWLVVREAEAGAAWPEDLSKKMFLPDGRLVDAKPFAYDQFRGALGGPEVIAVQSARRGVKPAFFTMVGGAIAGGMLSERHRVIGSIGGAVAGGILGLIFG